MGADIWVTPSEIDSVEEGLSYECPSSLKDTNGYSQCFILSVLIFFEIMLKIKIFVA